MFAIVKYTDNTMENYTIIEQSSNFMELEHKLHELRISYYGKVEKPIFRIVRIK